VLKATLAGDVDPTTAGRSFPGTRAADIGFFIRACSKLVLIRLADTI
jgi:hypothetical protein